MIFEEDYITDGVFDEELRLDKNYFYETEEETEQEELIEDLNEENGTRRSGEVTATVSSPYLNGLR